MADLSKDGEHVPEILSLTEQLYEKLKNAENQTLTREQVIAHLGELRTHYDDVVGALERIKKVTKKMGRKGGIELRTGSGIRLEILPCNREQLRQCFLGKFRPLPPEQESEGAENIADGEKKTESIRKKAMEILEGCPQGIRYAEWKRRIQAALPEANNGTIGGEIWDLDVKEPDLVSKPDRGRFLHTKYREPPVGLPLPPDGPEIEVETKGKNLKEHDFYEPFADWLVNELKECTKAERVGGNILGKKWGTPDVIGVRKQEPGAFIDLPTEIVSAEIKIDTYSLIQAFGQACAYRLFSHKSYIVVPENSPEDDIARLDALSRIFGIGLITFNPQNPSDPKFSIRARAAKHDPDMLYVNECMRSLWEAKIKLH